MATLLAHRNFRGNYSIASAVVVADGDFVGLDTDGKVALADADAPVMAMGIAKVSDGSGVSSKTGDAAGTTRCSIYKEGKIGGLTSLTPGKLYWLSTTAGSGTATYPRADNDRLQVLGRAVTATEVEVDVEDSFFYYEATAATTWVQPVSAAS